MTRADAVDAQPRGAALLPRQRSERQPGGNRLQGFLLPLPRSAHRCPRLALGAVDDRHRAADRRRADRGACTSPRTRADEIELRELVDALYRRIDWRWAQDGGDDDQAGLEARMRIPALRLGRLQRGHRAVRARAGLADAPARRATATRHGPRPTSGRICTATIFCMRGRCSCISSRTHGSIFAASRIASCARSAATISRTAGARRYVQREYARRNPHGFAGYDENCWGLTACDGPSDELPEVSNEPRRLFGYAARGVPYGPDDGTLAGWAALASLPFAPEIALARRAQHVATLSRDAVRTAVREQFQSDACRRRSARLGLAGPLRARPGHRGHDDRKPSHAADLAADAGLSLYHAPVCGAPDSAAAGCSGSSSHGSRRCSSTTSSTRSAGRVRARAAGERASRRMAQSAARGSLQPGGRRRRHGGTGRGARRGGTGREGRADRARSARRRLSQCRLRAVENDHPHVAPVCRDAQCRALRRADPGRYPRRFSRRDAAHARAFAPASAAPIRCAG